MAGRLRRATAGLVALGLLVAPVRAAQPELRLEHFTKRAAEGGGKLVPRVYTFFGGPSHEEFVAAGCREGGSVVAFGNAWGPEFPAQPEPLVLGKGEWHDVTEFSWGGPTGADGRPAPLAENYPNRAGMVVFFAPDLGSVERVVRFDWGVATITAGRVLADGRMLIAGRCTEHFRPLADRTGGVHVVPKPEGDRKYYGALYHEGLKFPGDVYVARLSIDASRLEWTWIFEGHRSAPRAIGLGKGGDVVVEVRGKRRISADGARLDDVGPEGRHNRRLMAVRGDDGLFVVGGYRHEGTGRSRETWRGPVFGAFEADGTARWTAWDWKGGLVAHEAFGLTAASTVTDAAFDGEGRLLVSGQSDGGASVFGRSPVDLERPLPEGGFGMEALPAGRGAASYGWLMRLDPERLSVEAWALWAVYAVERSREMGGNVSIEGVSPLADGSVAFWGTAGPGLVRTPGAWKGGAGEGGTAAYAAVFDAALANLRFSSHVPGCEVAGACDTRGGVVLVGRSRGTDGAEGARGPGFGRAARTDFGGGRYDAHLLLLGPAEEDRR